jgi:hypothetical protein
VTSINMLARAIAWVVAVAAGDYLFAGIRFAAPSQWVAVGLVMAVISMAFDAVVRNQLGRWISTLLFAVLAAGIIRLTPSLMPQVVTTRPGSIGVGLLLGLVQVGTHWALHGSSGLFRGRRVRPHK